VFEATVPDRALDGIGQVLVDQQAMATCGSGLPRTFDVTATTSRRRSGGPCAYFGSAKDG
jgi:hypothetical protein